jgi:hypothetical protein
MNFVASSPQAKEAKMLEIRVNYVDGTFEVMTVMASTIADANDEATAIASPDSEVESTTVLGSIDRQPQTFLAW